MILKKYWGQRGPRPQGPPWIRCWGNNRILAPSHGQTSDCLEGKLQLRICGIPTLLAMSLLWLGISRFFSTQLQVFDGLRSWYSSVTNISGKTDNNFRQIPQFPADLPPRHPHLWCGFLYCRSAPLICLFSKAFYEIALRVGFLFHNW